MYQRIAWMVHWVEYLWLSLANRSSAITSTRKNQLIRGGGVKLSGVVLANGDVDSPNTCMT
jgi:hypothetical protein